MFIFLQENFSTFIILLVIVFLIALAIRHIIKSKKKNKCEGCAMSESCPSLGQCSEKDKNHESLPKND